MHTKGFCGDQSYAGDVVRVGKRAHLIEAFRESSGETEHKCGKNGTKSDSSPAALNVLFRNKDLQLSSY